MIKPAKAMRFGAILIAVAALTFYFFYRRAQQQQAKDAEPLVQTQAVLNQPLPRANLVNVTGKVLQDDQLRRGKVVLTFTLTTCQICDQENDFLATVVGSRKDVSFYYVIPFGLKEEVLKSAQSKYALETFYDEGSMLAKTLEVYRVPTMLFLEDGIIKKTWLDGATVEEKSQAKFKQWLESL
jgi:cell division protein FtsI/penicillin-binding protein 2